MEKIARIMPENTRRPGPDQSRLPTEGVSSGTAVLRRLLGIGGLFRSGRGVALLSVVVAAAISVSAGLLIWHNRQLALDDRLRGMNSMGIVLVEQTSRYVQVIDMMLREVQDRISNSRIKIPAEFPDRFGIEEVQSYLAERVRTAPQLDAIFLIDANGTIFNWSQDGPVPRVDTTDRDYYRYFKENQDPGLFIGSIWKARGTEEVSLHFARRVTGPDGTFLGVVLGNVRTKYLSDFYQAAAEGLGESIALLRHDGTILMRYPSAELAIGLKLPQGSHWYQRVAEGGGNYADNTVTTGVPSLITVLLLPDYPLVIDILMDKHAVFAQWQKEAVYISGFAVAASAAFVGLFWTLGWQFRRLSESAMRLNEGQEILRSYAEMSSDWFWEQDENLRFKLTSRISFMAGKTRWEAADPAMGEERWIGHKADLAARRPFRDFRWERIDEHGSRRYISISGDPVFDRNGNFVGYRGTGRNITAEVEAAALLVQANAELEMGRQKFEAVLSNITQGVCFFDGDQRLLLSNRRYSEIYNLPAEAMCAGRLLKEVLDSRHVAGSSPDLSPSEYLAWTNQTAVSNLPSTKVVPLRNGRVISICHRPMPDGGWVATHEDITERQQAEARLVFLARHDALTGLPNRILFAERLERALTMVGRGSHCAVFCLDLDRFKIVNDTLGHPVGDRLLQAAAARLQACVREIDTVARLGGDEFAIIQTAVERPEDAELLANRIVTAFRSPFDVDEHRILAGTSIGVAIAPGDGTSPETLLKNADIALYLAKTEGGSKVRFFEPEMDAVIQLRRMLELDLRGAMIRNEFELYYQPLVNAATSMIVGFEALLRWHHPVRGLVSPAEFIPLAEETGMIVAIGEWVLQTACLEAENWPADISISVNLSPIQFKQGNLAAVVKAALDASGLPPDRLELEITETVLLQNTASTLAALHELRAIGVSVALDDFGTGYSSLSYLRSFPFDKIKIDQSFVRDLVKDKEALSIVRAITGLGNSLRMRTTAEGVETQEQLDMLRQEGCTEIQGYFFSRPKPASELPLLIERFNQMGLIPTKI